MSWDRIRTIIGKEWAEVFKNRLVLVTTAVVPFLLTAVALGQLAAAEQFAQPDAVTAAKLPARIAALCSAQGLAANECMQGFLANQMQLLFLLMPLIVPVTIAAYSIVGEKVARSLEPLLATPVSTGEIILGKSLAAAVPAVVVTWLAYGIYRVGAWNLTSGRLHAVIADTKWLAAMLLLTPLLAVFSVNVAIMISSRVNDPRTAEQLGMLVMLPLLAVFIGQISGVIALSLTAVLATCAVVLALDAALVAVAVRLFQRETILTRWR